MSDEPRPEGDVNHDPTGAADHASGAEGDAVETVGNDGAAHLDALASSLLWRIGRAYDDGPVTVRVGLASAAPLFAELPRLRAASDQEVEAALASGDVAIEWVGPRVGGGRG
jgi:hypothetical protein